MRIQSALVLAVLLLSSLPCPANAKEKDDGSTLTKVGEKAPSFEVTTLDGRRVKLEDLEGKVVFLYFFATWCGTCLEDLPKVEKEIWDRFNADPRFFLIGVAREQSEEDLKKYREKHPGTSPMAVDSDRQIYSRYATKWIPRHYLIDTDGTLLAQDIGEEDPQREKMVELISKRLSELTQESKVP